MRIGLVRSGIFDPPSHYNGHFFAKIQLLQKIIFVPRIVPAKTLPFTLQRTLLLKKLAPVFKGNTAQKIVRHMPTSGKIEL
jgi:hypothetical protein